uniref:STAS domain-containing protein n=1 Tax=Fagus sylvatica TaxID=28930 RepID=A0A2N9H186_FAGSY
MDDSIISEPLVSFAPPRNFTTTLKSDLKETFFPDDPFQFKNEKPARRVTKALQYFVPILEWLPKYNFRLLRYDILAGITITSLAIPQGISYAKLAEIPPIIGLYSSFVPPLIYAVFGSSKYLAVGTVAACSLLLSATIADVASPVDNPALYLQLIFTSTLITGIFQTALGFLRLGILVDFLSHSTITGFMGGTATIICLQQLKGFFGLKHFTTKTDVISVMHAIVKNRKEWKWESAVVGIAFLCFLQITRYVVGHLKKGINPSSIHLLNFDSKYLPTVMKAGIVTGLVALAEGIAIGRSFAILKNEQVDGNKEMVAFGLMNIVGSCTSCYLTTGPFSKTAVNFNAGCKTAMSNIVMAICMGLTLLFLAPLFSYTPLVALSAIIMSAMFGLIDYEEAYHLFKVDKFDFVICMAAFFGVSFISMDVGIMLSVGLGLIRALLYVARPATCKLGKVPNSIIYRDLEQYPGGFFGRSRLFQSPRGMSEHEHVLLDLTGVTAIDTTGIETLIEVRRTLQANHIKMAIINPRIKVMEKMITSKFIDTIGKKHVFLSIDAAIEACRFSLHKSNQDDDSP